MMTDSLAADHPVWTGPDRRASEGRRVLDRVTNWADATGDRLSHLRIEARAALLADLDALLVRMREAGAREERDRSRFDSETSVWASEIAGIVARYKP